MTLKGTSWMLGCWDSPGGRVPWFLTCGQRPNIAKKWMERLRVVSVLCMCMYAHVCVFVHAHVCVCVRAHAQWHTCGGQRTCDNWFSASLVWVTEIELRSLGLAANTSTFTHWSRKEFKIRHKRASCRHGVKRVSLSSIKVEKMRNTTLPSSRQGLHNLRQHERKVWLIEAIEHARTGGS